MRFLRVILALFFASAFPLAANECLLAAAFPAEVEDCCGGHAGAEGKGAMDRGCANCVQCATLATGANPATVVAFIPVVLEWREDVLFSAHLRAALAVMEKETPAVVPESPPVDRSLWLSVVRTALPVRGPSFA